MDSKIVKRILLDIKYISDINIKEFDSFAKKEYELLIFCSLEIETSFMPIVIGIPTNWDTCLFDIYLNIKKLPFIPHIDINGKLCLFELEGLLIDLNLEGLLNNCITRAREIISDGLNKRNLEDFINEFDSYLYQLPNCRVAQVCIPTIKKINKIQYSEKSHIIRKPGESYREFIRRKQQNKILVSNKTSDFATWNVNSSIRNGIYLYIELSNFLYPPNFNNFCLKDYLNNLLKYVDYNEFMKIIKKYKNEYILIFEIKQKNNFTNFFGILLNGAQYEYTRIDSFEIVNFKEIVPIVIERIDKGFLMNRTAQEENLLKNKSILLIGCGSIGGYIFDNLIKSGCEDITLVDFDILKAENIYRHLLGIESIGINKALALKNYAKKSIPNLSIKLKQSKIESLITNKYCNFDFRVYDYVISSTGNHNVNRWINKYIINNKIDTSAFYIWNEPLDLGCHVAFIDHNKKGCYECFFERDIIECFLYDKLSYCAPNQEFTKSVSGCAGTFIPYGSSISLKSSILFMECLKKVIYGKINNNFLASEKEDDFYFRKSDFKVSKVYTDQIKKIEIIDGIDFLNNKCSICGKK